MTMQRRHFELIAETAREMRDDSFASGVNRLQREMIAKQFADKLRATNPNFKRERFLKACGVSDA